MLFRIEFTTGLIGLLLAARGICADDWSTIKTGHCTIYYGKEFADDAQKARIYLDSAVESLAKEFSEHEPATILKKIDCHFYLHPEPNEIASDGRSVCITRGLDDGRRHAELHFLTPARYSPNSMNSMGELKKADHTFFRYIVHEYSSIWLGVIARGKNIGWYANGKNAPNWFWQGYEEYLGMTLSSAHSRRVTFSKYMAVLKENPDSVMIAHGYRDKTPQIVVQHDYTDGFALLAFMHHQFGKKAVQRILASEKETFREAMRDCFQMDETSFYEKYQEWVQEWKSP
jgi:hypothetical protein